MTTKYCENHFKKFIEQTLVTTEPELHMVMPLENSTEECSFEGCTEHVKKILYFKGESAAIGLPSRKDYIMQMHKELQVAIENGCVVEFEAAEKFLPNMPQLTLYKFLINKEMLVQELNHQELNK